MKVLGQQIQNSHTFSAEDYLDHLFSPWVNSFQECRMGEKWIQRHHAFLVLSEVGRHRPPGHG